MLMILARLVRSESFWAVAKVRSPHNRPEVWYPRSVVRAFPTTSAGIAGLSREISAELGGAWRRSDLA